MPAHLLVIDDDPFVRESLELELLEADFTVTTAEDGQQALNLAKDHRFDLVITDIRMPGLSGLRHPIRPESTIARSTVFSNWCLGWSNTARPSTGRRQSSGTRPPAGARSSQDPAGAPGGPPGWWPGLIFELSSLDATGGSSDRACSREL